MHLPGNWIIEHYWTYDIATFLEKQCPGFNTWMSFLLSIPLWFLGWVVLMLLLHDWQIFPAPQLTAEQRLAETRSVESMHKWLWRIWIGTMVVVIGGVALGIASGVVKTK
jgi:ABC-type dipeptide/oligopeptide/nickel transport system permease component